jgi:DNA-binding SARP family transcriptional activator
LLRLFCVHDFVVNISDHLWHLALLGGIELRGPDPAAAESVLVQPKHVALLAYLGVESSGPRLRRFHRRDHLVALFWPDLDQVHARASLRRVVHSVRSALGSDVLSSRGDEEIALGEQLLETDVDAFAHAIAKQQLARALELYRGELMPAFHLSGCAEFERWLDGRRNEIRRDAAAAALVLAQRLESDAAFTLAGKAARRAAELSWDDERIVRRALTMLERLGDRSGALRMYEEFSRRMRTEYDAAPSPETVALANRLRAG